MEKQKLPTVSIKGKEYVQVKDRILSFNKDYKNGMIQTEIVSRENGVWIIKATVTPDAEKTTRFFTGFSQAKEDGSLINKTSALENAETSAVGRALAMMGIGVIEGVGSADEMKKATVENKEEDGESHFCEMHQKEFRNRGKGVWDHRRQNDEGMWEWCQGKGYHLSVIQKVTNS